jgi:hypothetical protein
MNTFALFARCGFAAPWIALICAGFAASAWSQSAPARPAAKRDQFRNEVAASREAPLPPELLAIAERVFTGRIPCELGHNIALLPDPASPGYFTITTGKERYRLSPVATTTGAIRLEDKARGGVWLQLANKSMLLDEKNGRRLADECLSPAQKQVAEAIKIAPPPSVLGAPAGTVPNADPMPQPAVQPSESAAATPTTAIPAPTSSPTTTPAPLNLTLPR